MYEKNINRTSLFKINDLPKNSELESKSKNLKKDFFSHNIKQKKNILLEMIIINPENIRYIENPSKELIYECLKLDGLCIRYIENPTEEMKILSIKQNGLSVRNIDLGSNIKLMILGIKQNGLSIQYMNPLILNEDLKILAIKQNPLRFEFIKNPTEEMISLSQKKSLRNCKSDLTQKKSLYLKFSNTRHKRILREF